MNPTRIRTVTRRLAAPPDRGAKLAADADLLSRFLDAHDETAFEALVARHLPCVRAVCRSLLRDPNDADDAVQATFLVLVRRAKALRDRLALGAWLCRVAWRTANRLREGNGRRGERATTIDPDATPGREATPAGGGEVAAALHDEIARLPERYRLAVLTCYAAGTPTAEAATRLGWAKGTLLTRLAWARKRLRERLTKRGVTLGGGFTVLFAGRSGSAALLAGRITASAVTVASGDTVAAKEWVSDRVSNLTEGMVRTMIGTKIKLAVGIGFVAVALLGLGLGRMSAGAADAADKKLAPVVGTPAGKPTEPRDATPVKPLPPQENAEPRLASDVGIAAPGNDLVVRRPLGSFTREVAPYGKATLTFTESRLHVHATVSVEKISVTADLDADYSVNRESVVYGIITGADVTSPGAEAAFAVAPLAAVATDLPFCFRVRVEDDAITIKDLKVGPFGSPLMTEFFSKEDAKEMLLVTSVIGGKYKAEPNPERNPAVAPRRK